jgi:hypothetical protein
MRPAFVVPGRMIELLRRLLRTSNPVKDGPVREGL